MKLVRLVSTDNSGKAIFDNDFNSYINLKPYSKIALDTLCLDMKARKLAIKQDVNDEMRYKLEDGGLQMGNIRGLSAKTYTAATVDEFLEDLEDKLNANLVYVDKSGIAPVFYPKAIGLEWFVVPNAPNRDNKLLIGYNISPFTDFMDDINNAFNFEEPDDFWYSGTSGTSNIEKVDIATNNYHIIRKKANDANANNPSRPYIQSTEFLSKGGLNFRCGRMLLTDSGAADVNNQGFIMSIHTVDESNNENWVYGVRVRQVGQRYQDSTDGNAFTDINNIIPGTINIQTADLGDNSDCIEIIVNSSDIEVNIFQNGQDPYVYDTGLNIDFEKQYVARITMVGGKDHAQTAYWNYSRGFIDNDDDLDDQFPYIPPADDNFQGKNKNPHRRFYQYDGTNLTLTELQKNLIEHHPRLTATTPPRQDFTRTNNYFYLTEDLMRILGFNPGRYNEPNVFVARYVANKHFEMLGKSDNLIVQLNNIQIKSYDGNTLSDNGERRSILSLIPDDDSDNQTLFFSNERLFLDIDNSQEMNLTRISVSILDDNYEPIILQGLSSMSLVFKDENE